MFPLFFPPLHPDAFFSWNPATHLVAKSARIAFKRWSLAGVKQAVLITGLR